MCFYNYIEMSVIFWLWLTLIIGKHINAICIVAVCPYIHIVTHQLHHQLTIPAAQEKEWVQLYHSSCSPACPATSCGHLYWWSGLCHQPGSECLLLYMGWGHLWLGHTQTVHVQISGGKSWPFNSQVANWY